MIYLQKLVCLKIVCFINELPKQESFSIFECQICHNPYSRSVMNDKIMICDSCLDRIKTVENFHLIVYFVVKVKHTHQKYH